jgi:hypothetical protein
MTNRCPGIKGVARGVLHQGRAIGAFFALKSLTQPADAVCHHLL